MTAILLVGVRLIWDGAANVLVVLDIDNTLLATDQDLGGDAWFNWQAGLLKSEPKSEHLVAKSFGGLLRVQGKRVGDFAVLEAILDDSVGEPLAIRVERGGALVEVSFTVEDLHAITPARPSAGSGRHAYGRCDPAADRRYLDAARQNRERQILAAAEAEVVGTSPMRR